MPMMAVRAVAITAVGNAICVKWRQQIAYRCTRRSAGMPAEAVVKGTEDPPVFQVRRDSTPASDGRDSHTHMVKHAGLWRAPRPMSTAPAPPPIMRDFMLPATKALDVSMDNHYGGDRCD